MWVACVCVMDCLQVMDTGLFTDLLSAAMTESGLTDLEAYDDQAVSDSGNQLDVNAQCAVGTPTSQDLLPVSIQPPQIQTNSIILQHPRLQTPVRPVVVQNYADTAKGVRKIVIRPLPTGLQQSIASRQLQPVVLQSNSSRQPLIPVSVTSGLTAISPFLPVLRTTVPHTGSTTIICSQTVPSVSAVNIPSTTVRPALSPGTLRFTAIPRHLAARLPNSEANVSLQIRPKLLPASVIVPQSAAPVSGNTLHPRPILNQADVPLTTSNFVRQLPSSLSSTAVMSVSSSSCSVSDSISQHVASTATGYVCSVASVVSAVSCTSFVSTVNGMPIATSCLNTDSANSSSVTSASSHSELLLTKLNMLSQADTHIDSCSTVMSSGLPSSDQMAQCVCTSGAVSVSHGSVVSSGNVHTVKSSEQQVDLSCILTSSEKLTVTAAKTEAVSVASECTVAEAKSDSSTVNGSAAEANDQQVRNDLLGCIACTEYKDATQCYRCTMVCVSVCLSVCWIQP